MTRAEIIRGLEEFSKLAKEFHRELTSRAINKDDKLEAFIAETSMDSAISAFLTHTRRQARDMAKELKRLAKEFDNVSPKA